MVKKTKTTGNCKCENCIAFEKRIEKSKERIRNKLEDKELNNIYFLTLYELPFIFSDGKIIAGFREDNLRTSSDRSDKLIEQPLNTLHLTERVVKRDDKGIRDHFERLANAVKVKVGGGTKKLFEVESNAYEISNHKAGAFSLIDYCGLISGDKAKPGQYSDSAKVNFYLYKIPLKNGCSNYLYIIWSCGEKKITKRCRFKRYSALEKSMSELVENVDLTIPQSIHPFCKMSDEQPLMATLEFGSVEEFLRNRSYIDKAIDDLQADIAGKLRKYEPEKAEGEREEGAFRAILLRTKKPDANYLIIHVTPNMSKAAYKAICNLDDVALARQLYSVKSEFRQYFNLYIKPKNSALEWKTFCAEHSLRKIAYDCGCKNFTDTALKSIQDCHECDTNNCTECKNLAVDLKKLYLTFLAKTSMEYTPLLAGVAYEIGKRGIPDYSFDWTGHPLIVKHEKILNLDSKKLRYPDYFSNFIDKELLVQKEFRLMLDIPLVINGKLYGVFVIYPPPEITYEKLPDVLSEMMDVIERRRPDVLRAFFLDVCRKHYQYIIVWG